MAMENSNDGCQACVILPALPGDKELERFAQLAAQFQIASAFMVLPPDGVQMDGVTAARKVAHGANTPLVLDCTRLEDGLKPEHLEQVRLTGVDGVHILANESHYQMAREALGDEAIIGVDCSHSRHDAMTMGESGAQYIAVSAAQRDGTDSHGQVEDQVGWLSKLMTLPVIGWDPGSFEEARELARNGADFVAIGAPLWDFERGPVAAMKHFEQALDRRKPAG